MSDPVVCCVMLTRDRERMAARAVASFRAQTYERRELLIWEGGDPRWAAKPDGRDIFQVRATRGLSIGALRNEANAYRNPDIIAHWDDDDWSHPNRLAEQVALLQSSDADLVGFNEMLFWDTRRGGESWLWHNHVPPNYVAGTSMLYWRKTWEVHRFDAINHGEDNRFRLKCETVACSSLYQPPGKRSTICDPQVDPRMVCQIHGANSESYDPASKPASFKRVPEWDAYCAERMRL